MSEFKPAPNASQSDQRLLDVVNIMLKRFRWRATLDNNPVSPTYGRFLFLGAPNSGISESFETAAELKTFVSEQLLEYRVSSAITDYLRHSAGKGQPVDQAMAEVAGLMEVAALAAKDPAEQDDDMPIPGILTYRTKVRPRRFIDPSIFESPRAEDENPGPDGNADDPADD